MNPRCLLVLVAALTILVSGCSQGSGGAPAPDASGGHQTSAAVRHVKVKLPLDPPFYGSRKHGEVWRTSGHRPRPVSVRPYTNGILSQGQLSQPVDKHGVRLYEKDGKRYFHPVATAQYALAKLDQSYRTGSDKALRSAKVNAAKLIDVATRVDGGLYFAYPFDFKLGSRKNETIHSPWWSGMAQGQALSLFVRLYKATGQQKWRDAADKTFATLDDRGPRKKPWVAYVDKQHYLWFEEYAGDTKPLIVLNGDMFALFGIWDYQRLTGSKRAAELFDAGVTTLREHLPLYRHKNGGISYYCLRQPFCRQPLWQNPKYHGIVTRQMRFIADMSDDPWFRHEADRFQHDYDGWPLPARFG